MPYLQNPLQPLCQVHERPLAGTVVASRLWLPWDTVEGGLLEAASPPAAFTVKLSGSLGPIYNVSIMRSSYNLNYDFKVLPFTVTVNKAISPFVWKNTCIREKEEKTKLHKGRKLLQLVMKHLLFHTCSGETFLLSWLQFLCCLGLIHWKVKPFRQWGVGYISLASWGKLPPHILRTG